MRKKPAVKKASVAKKPVQKSGKKAEDAKEDKKYSHYFIRYAFSCR